MAIDFDNVIQFAQFKADKNVCGCGNCTADSQHTNECVLHRSYEDSMGTCNCAPFNPKDIVYDEHKFGEDLLD